MAKRIGIGILTIFVILVVYFIVRQAPIDRGQAPSLPFSQSPSVQTTSCILAEAFALRPGDGFRGEWEYHPEPA